MARRLDPSDRDPLLARKRTADMLRRLRELTKNARMLKSRVRTASEKNEELDRDDAVRRRLRGRRHQG
jgi:hypothetical protein